MSKRIIVMLLAVLMLFCAAGCGNSDSEKGSKKKEKSESSQKVKPEDIKTLGDAFKYTEEKFYGFGYDYFVYVFKESEDGDYYRAIAEFSEELYNKSEDISYDDEHSEEKIFELYKDVPVFKVENLTKGIPSKEELDKYVGKPGKTLLDDGFYSSGYYLEDEQINCYLSKGPYKYTVVFKVKLDPDSDFNEEEIIADLPVESIEYYELSSSATDYNPED